MGDAIVMFAELDALLEDPAFVRSPALVRMLKYLVEASAAGRGASLKSYTVAVEGLGRSPDFDSQVNTYSRVLASRLRKSLLAYYQGPGKLRPYRLEIPQGSYEVQLVSNTGTETGTSGPVPARAVAAPRWLGGRVPAARPGHLLLVVAAILAVGLAVAYWVVSAQAEARRWQTPNFPYVAVAIPLGATPAERERNAEIERTFARAITQYESVRLANRSAPGVNYVVELTPQATGTKSEVLVELVDLGRNRSLYSGRIALSDSARPGEADLLAIERTIFGLFGYAGTVTALETRTSFSADTPFECWLRFTNSVVVDGSSPDAKLKSCADDWYEQSPRHPLAAALYGWSLVSSTIGSPEGPRRDAKLREAVSVLETARSIDPGSRHAALALARAYAFSGQVDALREVAHDLASRPERNPDVRNAIGTMLVLQNDPSGEREIDTAIAFHPDPPPRYYIGKFIAAMMREDIVAAGKAIEKIEAGDQSSIWSDFLQTAYLARTGQVEAAKRVWARASSEHPLLGLFPERYLNASPTAEPVRRRMRKWLEPVLGS